MISNFYTQSYGFFYALIQVEVKIDTSREASKDSVLANFVIEAALYDTRSWYSHDGIGNLLSSNVANIKLSPSGASVDFPGYVLEGKLEMPRLWSAEQVRKLTFQIPFQIYIYHEHIKWYIIFPFLFIYFLFFLCGGGWGVGSSEWC